MAQGAVTLFNEFPEELLKGTHDFDTHVFKVAFITTLPTATQATPALADFTEVSGSNYTAGGITLTMVVSRSTNVSTVDSSVDPEWIQNASGPNNIKAGLIYNDTDAGKKAVGFVDMTTDNGVTAISLQSGNIKITWNAAGIFTLTR